MTPVKLSLILAAVLPAIYILILVYRLGVRALKHSEISPIVLVTMYGGSFIPAALVAYHVYEGGVDNCLPADFGWLARISILLGAVIAIVSALASTIGAFSEVLSRQPVAPNQ